MRFSSRFFLYGPFLLCVGLIGFVMIYWWFAAVALSKRLDALNGHDIAPGIRVSFAQKRIAGFPFRLDAIFTDFALETANTHGPIAWHTQHLATHTLTYARNITVLEAAGQQTLTWTNEHGRPRTISFVSGALRASADIESGKLARFDLDAISVASVDFAAGRAQFHLRPDPAIDALDLVADLQSVRFAGDAREGFANGLTHARLEGRLAPAAPFAAALHAQTSWLPVIEQWRVGRGAFKVDEAALAWDKCDATSSGFMAADSAHRPMGSLAFSLDDCGTLTTMKTDVAPGAHRAMLAVLSDIAAHEPADKNGALAVMLVFKDGILFVGPGKAIGANSTFEPVAFLHALY